MTSRLQEGRRDRRRRHRDRPAQEGGLEDRRDVARHGLDEDEPGAPVSAVCPNGHTSEAEDYCDTCGSPIDASAQPAAGGGALPARRRPAASGPSSRCGAGRPAPPLDLDPPTSTAPPRPRLLRPDPAAPAGLVCPNCQTENPDGALFCEACGYDFTTGAMPRDPPAGPGDLADTEPDGEAVGHAVAGPAACRRSDCGRRRPVSPPRPSSGWPRSGSTRTGTRRRRPRTPAPRRGCRRSCRCATAASCSVACRRARTPTPRSTSRPTPASAAATRS